MLGFHFSITEAVNLVSFNDEASLPYEKRRILYLVEHMYNFLRNFDGRKISFGKYRIYSRFILNALHL